MMRAFLARTALLTLLSMGSWAPVAQSEGLQGTPLLRRYVPEDYRATPQHWAIATDREGRLYVGNDEGVLHYDGERWDLIGLPGRNLARDVAAGNDGRIYVGGYDTFGWLETRSDGQTVYRELLTAAGLKGSDRRVGDVWQVIPTGDGVYFRTEGALHLLDYDQRLVGHWALGPNQRAVYAEGDRLYSRIDGLGFTRFVDGRFQLEPGGAAFSRQGLLGVVAQPGWLLLVGDQEFFRADSRGIRPLPGDAGAQMRDNDPYTVLPLGEGGFAVGTLGGDVLRYAGDGRLLERISLGSFGINALATDHEGGLWAATEGDLVRMSTPSPWSFVGAQSGLDGTVFDFEWHDDALWLATSRGLTRMQPGRSGRIQTRHLPWLGFEGFALVGTDAGLLIGHRDGLMVLDPGATKPRPLIPDGTESVLRLVESRFDPDRAYGVGDQRLFVLMREQGRWQLAFALPLSGASATSLLETGPGELWFGDSRGGPQRWTLDVANRALLRKQVFGPSQGLGLDPEFGSSVFLLDGRVHVTSGDYGSRWDGTGFVADTDSPLSLVDRRDELIIEDTPVGAYAFTRRQMWFRAPGQRQWQQMHLGSPLAAGYNRLRYNHDGIVRVASWNGLLQFDPARTSPAPPPLALGFTYIAANDADGSQMQRLPLVGHNGPARVPAGSQLHFRYGMISMDSSPEYRYRLDGDADAVPREWSRWSGGELTLAAVDTGDYVLTVEGRTASGREAAPIRFRYRVLPRWHAQWWARIAWVLLAFGITVMAIREFFRRRTERLTEANRRLEARIGERTHELEEVNRKLAGLATEDALTGVANRRAMQNGLQREWVRCMDQCRPLSVLMIDVDFFKRYNDTHGHLEGDVLLRRIAQGLHGLHDPTRELLARFGGEEFALLLPGVTRCEAMRRAEHLRGAIQECVPQITVSIGVAGFVPTPQDDSIDLLRRADAALYRAKRAGRNRVEAAIETPDPVPG